MKDKEITGMAKKFFIVVFLCIIGTFLFQERLVAYSTEVHKEITKRIIKQNVISLNKSINNYTGFSNGVKESINKKFINEWIEDGSFAEDTTGGGLCTHFYNPLTNLSGVCGESTPSAYDWANTESNAWSWQKARDNFYDGLTLTKKTDREKSLAKAFKALGHVVHLLQDVAVPAHARGDLHAVEPLGTILFTGNDSYEKYTNKNISELNYSQSLFGGSKISVSPGAPRQFWDVDIYTTTTFPDSNAGLAEYASYNFLSDDTIFKNMSYPKYSSESYEMYDVEHSVTEKRIYLRKKGDGETIEHFATYGPLSKHLSFDAELQHKSMKLDDKCHYDYAQKLTPRAVGYSAGLLNYFFRGDINMIPDEDSGSGYVIVNNTDEDMNGAFELWYDNKNDERLKVSGASWALSINKKDPNNSNANKSANITFTPPTDMKEENKYLLVFQGKLGNEQGAIIGKQVELGSRSLFLANISRDILPFNISVENSKYVIKPADSSLVTKIKNASINASSALLEISSTPDNYKHSIKVPQYAECYSTDINRYAETFKSCIHDGITKKIRIGGPNTCRPKSIYAPNEPSWYGFYELLGMGSSDKKALGRNNFTFNQDKTMLISIDNFVKLKSIKDDYTYGTLPPYTATTTIARDYQKDYFIDNRSVTEDLLLTSDIIKWNQYGSYISEDDGQGNTKSVFRRWNTEENVWNNIIAVLDENNAIYSKTSIISSSDWTATSESDNHSATSVENKSADRPGNYKLIIGATALESIDSAYKYTKHVNSKSEPNIQPVHVITQNTDNPTITYNVMSYDNKYGTDYVAVIYSIQTQKNNIKVDITYPPDNVNPNYKDTEATDIKNTYHLYYKINDSIKKLQLPIESSTTSIKTIEGNVGYNSSGNPLVTERNTGLVNITLQEESSTLDGSRITGASCQVNKTNIVYTYIVERYEDNEWKFGKRIIGIINVADGKLAIGYRQEFEITETNASGILTGAYSSFNYKDPAAIGFHVETK